MKNYPINITIYAQTEQEKYCAELFSEEWKTRTDITPQLCSSPDNAHIVFCIDESIENKDTYIINEKEILSYSVFLINLFRKSFAYIGNYL